jgi:hypothetical protein
LQPVRWLVADGWCWFVLREEYCWLVAGGWFVVREKYYCLVAGGFAKLYSIRNREVLVHATGMNMLNMYDCF